VEQAPVEGIDFAQRKAALRDRMRRVRAAIPEAEREDLAARLEDHLLALPEMREARTVMLFASFGSEISTERIVHRLDAEGRTVLLPFVAGDELGAAPYRPGDPTTPSAYGPLEPAARAPVDPEHIDVVLLPGLAFDRRGRRLGYGGAHYDRYMPRLRGSALRVGIAFHQQVVDEVPADVRDEPVDVVVTDREVIRTRAKGSS
jgi:5-formyltetrahydrofolate cyclo-ligase